MTRREEQRGGTCPLAAAGTGEVTGLIVVRANIGTGVLLAGVTCGKLMLERVTGADGVGIADHMGA